MERWSGGSAEVPCNPYGSVILFASLNLFPLQHSRKAVCEMPPGDICSLLESVVLFLLSLLCTLTGSDPDVSRECCCPSTLLLLCPKALRLQISAAPTTATARTSPSCAPGPKALLV